MSQTPAGWYPQPDGRQRYWDGQAWTDQFAPAEGGAAGAPFAAPQQAVPAKRAWYKKKRVIIPAALVAIIAFSTALNGGDDDTSKDLATVAADSAAPAEDASATKAPAPSASKPAAPKPAAKPAEPKMTKSQRNALRAAENYIAMMGMSKARLIDQLSSSAGDGYSKADATFAANHVKADWNAEAVEAAEGYMEIMPMSRSRLIQQLSSSAGDKFTKAQATHAADAVL